MSRTPGIAGCGLSRGCNRTACFCGFGTAAPPAAADRGVQSTPVRGGTSGGSIHLVGQTLKKCEDRIGHVSPTSNKKMKKIARINSTPQVPRAGMFIVLSVLEVTQRVQATLHVASVTHVGIESGAGDGGAPTTS